MRYWTRHLPVRMVAAGVFGASSTLSAAAFAAPKDNPAQGLLGILAVTALLAVLGVALGSLGLTVGHVFKRRSQVTFRVMCQRPGWSLLTGFFATVTGMGLLAVLRLVKPLQLVVLVALLVGLVMFGLAAAARLGARVFEPSLLDEESPSPRTAIQGGVLLLGMNAVPLVGTLLFLGIVLAGIGATLLGYFAALGGALKGAAQAPQAPAPPPPSTPPDPPAQ